MLNISKVLFTGALVLLVAACTQTGFGSSPSTDGPRYAQPGVGAPAKQTDFFGNDVLPRTP